MANMKDTGSAFVYSVVTDGFALAANYHKVRSGYTEESVEFLLSKVGLLEEGVTEDRSLTVLELGCGTGKFTQVLLDILKEPVRIIASDPLESMVKQFKDVLPDVELIQCPAQEIPLPSSSVDVVLAAQSFHWFASHNALAEIHRVLVPGGRLGIIQNCPDDSEAWIKEISDFYSPLYRQKSAPNMYENAWKNELLSFEGFCEHSEDDSFRLFQKCTIATAHSIFASASVVVSGTDNVKATFKKLFDQLVKTHFQEKGKELCHIPYVTTIWCCKKQN